MLDWWISASDADGYIVVSLVVLWRARTSGGVEVVVRGGSAIATCPSFPVPYNSRNICL